MESLKSCANVAITLKQLRKSKGLRQKNIAMKLGITIEKYSRYEIGLTEIPVSMLTPIAREFQISVSYLIELIAESHSG